MKMDVSSDWTERERLAVIAEIATRLADKVRCDAITSRFLYSEMAEKIVYVASCPASFLNTNRARILEGIGK